MKLAGLALSSLILAGCAPAQPLDCKAVARQMLQCTANKGGQTSFFECQPYSKSQRIKGTFAYDFEFNEFYEGRKISADHAWQFPERSTKLLIGKPLHLDANGNPKEIVTYLVFEGRRPLCDLIPEERWLIVDRIISEELIRARQSTWYR